MIIPGGLASETSFKDTKYCVLTEFAQRPKPRVTTTISINGEVVEKVENIWERLPQTEEDRKEIEGFLKRQHQQVLQQIKNKHKESVSSEPQKRETAGSRETLMPRVEEELSKTDGVFGWVFVSEDERISVDSASQLEEKDSGDIVHAVKRFSCFLSSITRLGDFVGGVLEVPGSCMVFLPLQTRFLAIQLDPKVDVKKLIKKVKSII